MPNEPQKDLVVEARELLGNGAVQLPLRVEGWHQSLSAGGWFIRQRSGRTLMTVEFVPAEIDSGIPAKDGNAPARTIAALLNVIPQLCDEIERLRSLVRTMDFPRGD